MMWDKNAQKANASWNIYQRTQIWNGLVYEPNLVTKYKGKKDYLYEYTVNIQHIMQKMH